MGNQSTKTNVLDKPITIDRSPGRNRNFCDVLDTKYMKSMEKVKPRVNLFEETCEVEPSVNLSLYKGLSRSVSTNFVDSVDDSSSLSIQSKNYRKPNKVSGKDLIAKREQAISKYHVESLCSTESKIERENVKPLKYRKKRQRAAIKQVHSDKILAKEILNTVTELEDLLQGERQHERRLRRALIQQFQSLQQLRTSLQLEKDRNERLMELMNHYNKEDLNIYNTNVETITEHLDENKRSDMKNGDRFSYHDIFSSMSPVLMQQRYEELYQSFINCQNELQKKNHLLNMSQYKQEALQLEYDRLLEELKASEKLISDLKRKIASAKKKKISKAREMTNSESIKVNSQNVSRTANCSELILYEETKLEVNDNSNSE